MVPISSRSLGNALNPQNMSSWGPKWGIRPCAVTSAQGKAPSRESEPFLLSS